MLPENTFLTPEQVEKVNLYSANSELGKELKDMIYLYHLLGADSATIVSSCLGRSGISQASWFYRDKVLIETLRRVQFEAKKFPS